MTTRVSIASFVTSDGVELVYHDTGGSGEPLILIHGWGQTQAMFVFQLSGLAERYRVISFDQRGHGESAKPHHGYRIPRLAKDLWELLDHLRLASAHLIGWSMGACVVWSSIDQWGTDRIQKLVLVDQPAALAAVPWMSVSERLDAGATMEMDAFLELGEALAGPDGSAVLEKFERTMFSGVPSPEVWDLVTREIRTVPPHVSVPLLFSHATQDWRDVLPRIDVPTLVIGCEGSHVSVESQRYVARSIPGSRLHIFDRDVANSHFPFLEVPDQFNALVANFLT